MDAKEATTEKRKREGERRCTLVSSGRETYMHNFLQDKVASSAAIQSHDRSMPDATSNVSSSAARAATPLPASIVSRASSYRQRTTTPFDTDKKRAISLKDLLNSLKGPSGSLEISTPAATASSSPSKQLGRKPIQRSGASNAIPKPKSKSVGAEGAFSANPEEGSEQRPFHGVTEASRAQPRFSTTSIHYTQLSSAAKATLKRAKARQQAAKAKAFKAQEEQQGSADAGTGTVVLESESKQGTRAKIKQGRRRILVPEMSESEERESTSGVSFAILDSLGSLTDTVYGSLLLLLHRNLELLESLSRSALPRHLTEPKPSKHRRKPKPTGSQATNGNAREGSPNLKPMRH